MKRKVDFAFWGLVGVVVFTLAAVCVAIAVLA